MIKLIKQIKDRIEGKAPAGAKRSSQWPKVRAEHLKAKPNCEVCGSLNKTEVHHIVPFHEDPSKELDPKNLITLCENWEKGICCHLLIGHLGNYKNSNKDVRKDATTWRKKLKKNG